jgi:alcohol dehydrogenase class IV
MALASLFGGLALANAGLGAVHSFAASIGGMFHAPHGAVCAALLPHVMKINLIALHERAPNNEAVRRYDHVAQILTGNQEARAADGILWIRDLCSEMQVSSLSAYEVTEKDFSTLVEKSAKASSMRANPVVLNPDELREILAQAL